MKTVLKRVIRHIPVYIVWLIVTVFLWLWLFGFLTKIKPEEKINVFAGTFSQTFEDIDKINLNRPEYLKKIEVNTYSLDNIYFGMFLSVHGFEESDILILPEDVIEGISDITCFSTISEQYQLIFNNLGLYKVEGKTYGLKVHDKLTHDSLISCLDYGKGEKEEDFYLFFNIKSLHLSDLSNADKKNKMDGAIKIAQELLAL